MSSFTWESLRDHPLAARLLEPGAEPHTFTPGQHLLISGEVSRQVWFVESGVVRIFHDRPERPSFTTKILQAPLAMGMVEVLNQSAYVGSVEALSEVRAIRVDAEAFRAAVEADPAFTRAVLREITNKYEGSMLVSREIGLDDTDMRLLRLFLEYAAHFGRPTPEGLELRYPLPLERLAGELGTSRRTVDRALLRFRRLNLVWRSPKGWLMLAGTEPLRSRLARKAARSGGKAGPRDT